MRLKDLNGRYWPLFTGQGKTAFFVTPMAPGQGTRLTRTAPRYSILGKIDGNRTIFMPSFFLGKLGVNNLCHSTKAILKKG